MAAKTIEERLTTLDERIAELMKRKEALLQKKTAQVALGNAAEQKAFLRLLKTHKGYGLSFAGILGLLANLQDVSEEKIAQWEERGRPLLESAIVETKPRGSRKNRKAEPIDDSSEEDGIY